MKKVLTGYFFILTAVAILLGAVSLAITFPKVIGPLLFLSLMLVAIYPVAKTIGENFHDWKDSR